MRYDDIDFFSLNYNFQVKRTFKTCEGIFYPIFLAQILMEVLALKSRPDAPFNCKQMKKGENFTCTHKHSQMQTH